MAGEILVRLGYVKEKPSSKPVVHRHRYRKDGTCACGAKKK